MRVVAPLFGLVMAVAVVVAFLSAPRPVYVPLVPVRDLLRAPDTYHGHTIRVRVSDMIPGPNDTLEYHVFLHEPPVVVLSWAGTPPAHTPASVTGVFRNGTPATLTGCRPAR